MKICMISPYYPPHVVPDGIGDYTQKLCEEMAALGHEIIVLVSEGYQAETTSVHNRIKIIPFTSSWNLTAFLKLIKLCRNEKYDLVNLQYSPPLYGTSFKLLYLFIGLFCPSVVTLHTLIGGNPINKIVALFFILFCTKIISTNEEITYLIKKYLPWETKIAQIPIGSNIVVSPQDKVTIKKNKITLAHFGLFYPGKGVETILTAASELKKTDDNFQLLMLGGKWPGAEDYYHELQQQAQQLGLNEQVKWLGYLPENETSKYLSITDILLLPYDRGISIRRGSLMAGLTHGLPIISTFAKIESAYIKENENIALIPPKDPVALKDKILELIQNPTQRKHLGENAKRLASDFYWPKIASEMVQEFERVIG